MRDALAHRGPDGFGLWVRGRVGLGHRRLSIIDLSERGAQPMRSDTGTVALVFNGEIYNFQELRRTLEARGHRFRSRTDTEALLHAYEEYGVDCLRHLRGMFAFALWDSERQQLFAARDRLGKKPFFYAVHQGEFSFGSEIKAILARPHVRRELDTRALGLFLSLNYTPAPHTLFRGIRQLEPAQYLLWRDGELTLREYWDLAYPWRGAELRGAAARSRFEAELEEAVRLRLIADVPVGAFLSGGLDSTTIVAEAARLYPGRLKTFTIGFGEKSYDERPLARQVAASFGTEHHEILVTPRVTDVLPALVWHAEEPTADSSMLPVYYLAEFASRQVKVVLTGDGADELLAGYPTYQAHYLLRFLQTWPRGAQRALRLAVEALPVSHRKVSWDFKLKRLVAALDRDADYAHYSWRQIWSRPELQALVPGVDLAEAAPLYTSWLGRCASPRALDRMLYADTRFYLPNDMLVKVDRMTMAHGLEARTPFLDHGLVETAAQLSPDWKLKGLIQKKYLLRRLLKDRVPASIRRQPKRGFNVPVGLWIKNDLRDFFGDHLGMLKQTGLFNMKYLEQVFEKHLQDKVDYSHHLWGLLVLSLWWQRFLKSSSQ